MTYIGIDPGTHTGLAVCTDKKIVSLETLPIHKAMDFVAGFAAGTGARDVLVVFEDARQRTWFGKGNTSAKLQGAGSVKRDCSIWEDFLVDKGIPFRAVPPVKGGTKVSPEFFRKLTGYTGRTSEHSRDAAMLVFGR